MELEMPPGAQGWTVCPGPRNQFEEVEPFLREGDVVCWVDAYLGVMGKVYTLDSYRAGFESQLCTY